MDNSTRNLQNDSASGDGVNIAFVLVPLFFVLGLLGVLVCHLLKRKGYRCTTAQEEGERSSAEEKDIELQAEQNDTVSDNDTVGQIVGMIMKNKANSEALKAMVHENSIDSDGAPATPTSVDLSIPATTPTPPAAPAAAVAKHTCNHLHTIGGISGQKNMCTRCNQKKWPLIRKPSARKAEQRRSQLGEVTVLAVGRFRVTKCEKPTRDRRTQLLEANGSGPATPTLVEPPTRETSESQQEPKENQDKEKR